MLEDIVYYLIFAVLQQCKQIIANLDLLLTHLIIVCDMAEIRLQPIAFLKFFWCSFCFNVTFYYYYFLCFYRLHLIGDRLWPLRRQLRIKLLKVMKLYFYFYFAAPLQHQINQGIANTFFECRWLYWNRHYCQCCWAYSRWDCCCLGSQVICHQVQSALVGLLLPYSNSRSFS